MMQEAPPPLTSTPLDPVPPTPVSTLDYAPPPAPQRGWIRDMVVGMAISLTASLGTGLVSFGLLLANRVSDQAATFVAVGISFLTLAASGTVLLFWLRATTRR
jgi:hypothetical protein